MTRVIVNGVALHVEVAGEGVPIFGVHGSPSSAVMWEEAAVVLARHGRCITYDRRGFLRSREPAPAASVDLADHVDDALALLARLDAVPAIVIGRSTGGLIALELALRAPAVVRALVLLEPAVFTLDDRSAAWAVELRTRLLEAESRDPSAVAEAVIRLALGDATWESFPADLREMFAGTNDGTRAELHGDGLDLSARPRVYAASEFAALAVPTLGWSRPPTPPMRSAAALPPSPGWCRAPSARSSPAGT